jgi:hypothetical protein
MSSSVGPGPADRLSAATTIIGVMIVGYFMLDLILS